MANEDLIKALRNCGSALGNCGLCFYKNLPICHFQMAIDAADALEECIKKENALRSLIDGRGDPVSCNVDAILKGEYE